MCKYSPNSENSVHTYLNTESPSEQAVSCTVVFKWNCIITSAPFISIINLHNVLVKEVKINEPQKILKLNPVLDFRPILFTLNQLRN